MNDSKLPNDNPLLLIELFLSGTISPEEAQCLYRQIQEDSQIGNHLCQNAFIDFLLKEDADFELRTRQADQAYVSGQDRLLNAENDRFWECFPEEHAGKAIAVPSFLPEQTPSVWKRLFSFHQEQKKEKSKKQPRYSNEKSPREPSRIPFVIALCGIAFLLGAFLVNAIRNRNDVLEAVPAIARITDTVDVQWGEGTFPFRRGQSLGPNKLSLDSGMVKLEYANGTTLILNGPGEYTLNSNVNIFCNKGNLSAFVSDKNSGFGVTTPSMNIIDRGTAFYVDVAGEESSVGVVSGRVDLITRLPEQATTQIVAVTKGKAMQHDMGSAPKAIELDITRFTSSDTFAQYVQDYVDRETLKSNEANRWLDTDPDLLVRFDFSKGEKNVISNDSSVGKELCRQGDIRGCRLGEGRFAGTQALVFGKRDSRVDFALPGEYETLTLYARVRIRALSNWGSILFAAGDSMEKEGSFLWQLTRDGQIHLLVKPQGNKTSIPFHTETVFSRRSWGGWYRLAVVLDSRNQTITHYVDGKRIAEFPWRDAVPLKPYVGTLGNAARMDKSILNRFLDGDMDRFLVLKRALSDKEIALLE